MTTRNLIVSTIVALIVSFVSVTGAVAAEKQINVNTADAQELSRLFRVGPKLAEAIVADRTANGPFEKEGPKGLTRVMRVGERTVENNAWIIIYDENDRVTEGVENPNPSTSGTTASTYTGPVNPNTAPVEHLTSLMRVGEKLAQAIIADREANGAFKDAEDFKRVPRIGDRIIEINADRLVFDAPAN